MILSNISIETILSWVSIVISFATMGGSVYVFWRYDKRINKQNILINEFTLKEQKDPYSCLTPGASITIHYGLLSGYQKDPVLKFYWEDDYDNSRSVKHTVFLG